MAHTVRRFLVAAAFGTTIALTSAGAASAGGIDQLTTADKTAAKTQPSELGAAAPYCSSGSVRQLNYATGPATSGGSTAITVRQFIGYCHDGQGWAWMNFSSVYVWDWFHTRVTSYRATAGISVNKMAVDSSTGGTRQQLTYSPLTRTVQWPTQGWGKVMLGSGSVGPVTFTPIAP